jgi:hypothetical protein
MPSGQPSTQPSGRPSMQPSGQPSSLPTAQPTAQPSGMPSISPTDDKFPVWAIVLIVVSSLLTCFFIAGYMGIFNRNEVAPDPDPEDPDLDPTAHRADDNSNPAQGSAESSASPPQPVVPAAEESELLSTVRRPEPTYTVRVSELTHTARQPEPFVLGGGGGQIQGSAFDASLTWSF